MLIITLHHPLINVDAISDCFDFKQIINIWPYLFCHYGTPPTIDLAFLSSNLDPLSGILPPVSSSDHNSILFSLPTQ